MMATGQPSQLPWMNGLLAGSLQRHRISPCVLILGLGFLETSWEKGHIKQGAWTGATPKIAPLVSNRKEIMHRSNHKMSLIPCGLGNPVLY